MISIFVYNNMYLYIYIYIRGEAAEKNNIVAKKKECITSSPMSGSCQNYYNNREPFE